MKPIPHLDLKAIEEIRVILRRTLEETNAATVVLSDRGGYKLSACKAENLDSQTLASLSANLFSAAEFVNSLLGEPAPMNLLQKGQNVSILVCGNIDSALLTILFKSNVEAGWVKFFASGPLKEVSNVFEKCRIEYPGQDFDPADIDLPHLEEYLEKRQ